jgi:hypothetical protein
MDKVLLDRDKNRRCCFQLYNRVTSGVPQGTLLGPLYFIWFVNKISIFLDYVRVLLYADEMKLFQDCMKIQSDLNKLSEWCERNSLFL